MIKERFREHLDDYRLRPQKSAMGTHSNEKHNGEKVNFHVKIRGVCPGDPLLRQCMKYIYIVNILRLYTNQHATTLSFTPIGDHQATKRLL